MITGRALVLSALCLLGTSTARAQSWEEISNDDGITVWQREVPNTSFVEFRAKTTIQASIVALTAVLRDNDRKTEWLQNCSANTVIQWHGSDRAIIYNRTQSPAFFISDRDVVMDIKARLIPEERAMHISAEATKHPKGPEIEGVVRIPRLSGYWHLVYKAPQLTEVTYQMQVDPGGSLPAWLVNWASKSIPGGTLVRLRDQVKKPIYEKDLAIVEGMYDWDLIMKPGQPAQADPHAPAKSSAATTADAAP
jgi:hypothetical protein